MEARHRLDASKPAARGVGRVAFIQVAVFGISLINLVWSVVGLVANPDFAVGDDATAKRVLGIDFNAWHALSGIVPLFLPGLVAAFSEKWAFRFAVYAAIALCGSAVVIFFVTRPLPVLFLPHNQADAALHLAAGATYGLAAWLHLRLDR
jgi:hypothetical protein